MNGFGLGFIFGDLDFSIFFVNPVNFVNPVARSKGASLSGAKLHSAQISLWENINSPVPPYRVPISYLKDRGPSTELNYHESRFVAFILRSFMAEIL